MLKNNNRLFYSIVLFAMCLAMVSCGTKKSVTSGGSSSLVDKNDVESVLARKTDFLRKVYDNEVYAQCLSAKIKFSINTGSKDLSVSGSLKMKKDDVIRIQLTPLGLMEAGRIEFTKDYVLVIDRINKEYIKASYNDVDFLQRNGLDFYALQALFWNQLFVPGQQKITDSALKNFGVTFNDAVANTLVTLKRGNMNYVWQADKTSGQIKAVDVTYSSQTAGNTSVKCTYGTFKPLGTKRFPTDITLMMQSSSVKMANGVAVNISMSGLDTSADWETRTTVSDKYKKVDAQDVMNRILKL